MKIKYHILTAITMFLFAFTSMAQNAPLLLSGTPSSVQTNTTWSTGSSAMNISGLFPNAKDVAIGITYKLGSDAGNSNITFTVQKSVSGTYWQTLGTIVSAANGSNVVSWTTNYTVGAVGYLRIGSIANNNDAASGWVTNLAVRWTAK